MLSSGWATMHSALHVQRFIIKYILQWLRHPGSVRRWLWWWSSSCWTGQRFIQQQLQQPILWSMAPGQQLCIAGVTHQQPDPATLQCCTGWPFLYKGTARDSRKMPKLRLASFYHLVARLIDEQCYFGGGCELLLQEIHAVIQKIPTSNVFSMYQIFLSNIGFSRIFRICILHSL